MSQLDILSPAPVSVQVLGREIKLYPLKIRQLPLVVRVMRPFLSAITEDMDFGMVADVYCEHAVTINEALAEMSGLSVAEIEDLQLEDGIGLFFGCIEANKDFFIKTLPSMMAKLTAKSQ